MPNTSSIAPNSVNATLLNLVSTKSVIIPRFAILNCTQSSNRPPPRPLICAPPYFKIYAGRVFFGPLRTPANNNETVTAIVYSRWIRTSKVPRKGRHFRDAEVVRIVNDVGVRVLRWQWLDLDSGFGLTPLTSVQFCSFSLAVP